VLVDVWTYIIVHFEAIRSTLGVVWSAQPWWDLWGIVIIVLFNTFVILRLWELDKYLRKFKRHPTEFWFRSDK